ncbi:hypothetical protein [Alkalibacillus almallahensis]|uniref:hypothetical protein n=1 Tax=Alkalibacillus almallahensis TaxID=1379154 RepID=UPI001421823C|nr:hypothetical protein [Alkalibacillus almallahensis]NIK12832.1 ABC-type antimicrobial peptide transport system permease subunit [Alkalibacillus almallahensis]
MFRSKTFKVIAGIFVVLLAFIVIVGVTEDSKNIPEYEIVEEDDERENVLRVRAVTDSDDPEQLENLAEHLSEEVRDTDTFDGLNLYAAYIRIHEDVENDEFGALLLDSKIAYRSEGLPITGLDETEELHISD